MGKKKYETEAPEAPKSDTGQVDGAGEVEKDPNEGQLAISGAEPPPFVPIAVLRDRYLETLNAESEATAIRVGAEHMLAERIASNKNKPYPIRLGPDAPEKRYRSRCRKGADPKVLGSLAISEVGTGEAVTGTEY